MTSFDSRIAAVLDREVPLRTELEPAWTDVLVRARRPHAAPTRRRRRRLTSRWALVAALVAAAGLGVGGLALADAVEQGSLHAATIDVSATTLANGLSTCGLIGEPAGQVAAMLTGNGIAVEWRFTHWGTTAVSTTGEPTPTTQHESAEASARAGALEVAAAEAVTGGSSDPVSSVPSDSVVWDVLPDGQTKALVFVEAPNDPNAPTVATENCG